MVELFEREWQGEKKQKNGKRGLGSFAAIFAVTVLDIHLVVNIFGGSDHLVHATRPQAGPHPINSELSSG